MLRNFLPIIIAALFAAGILAGYNVAFAQDITSADTLKAGQDANTTSTRFVLVSFESVHAHHF